MLKLSRSTRHSSKAFTGLFRRAVFSSAILTTLAIPTHIGFAQRAHAADQANDLTILTFVRHYEARGNYDIYYTGIRTAPPKPLTQMTVGEVMAWQASLTGVKSTAAGGYQIIKTTLATLVKKHRIDRKALFDTAMQDRLGALLIANCQTRNNTPVFANCLAGIWAALPRVTGANRGRSNYHGIAGNKALTTPENVLAMLEGRRFHLKPIAPRQLNLAAFGSTPLKISVTGPTQPRNARSVILLSATARRDQIREAMGQGKITKYTIDPYVLE